MHPRITIAIAALLSLSCGSETSVTDPAREPVGPPTQRDATPQATVRITDAGFEPATLVVRPGARVSWFNTTSQGHSIAYLDASQSLSGVIPPDAVWESSIEFSGTFKYRCEIHGGIEKGRIFVAP